MLMGKSILLGSLCAVSQLAAAPHAAAEARPNQAARARESAFATDVDELLRTSMARMRALPGVAIAVARHDRPLFVRGYGRADIARNARVTAATRFYVGSSTKPFVALMVAALDRRGVIDLDWTLAELAPDVRFAADLRADRITLRHLLSHSHGIRSWPIEFRMAFSGEHTPTVLWELLSTLAPNPEAPLDTFSYSNIGYNVATLLIERRLGRRWQDLLEAEVLRPLRARQTLAQRLRPARARASFAASYFSLGPSGPELIGLVKTDATMHSAGGLYSSANDLTRWLRLHLSAALESNRNWLPSDLVRSTHRPVVTASGSSDGFSVTGYGLGWHSGVYQGGPIFHAFGGYAGARSHVSFMPTEDLGVAVVTNDEGFGAPFIHIVASFAYDWFRIGPERARARANESLSALLPQADAITRRVTAGRAERAARIWRLSLPASAYGGRFCNREFGTIRVVPDGQAYRVSMGSLSTIGTPLGEPDGIRVELIPYQGMALQFTVAGGRADEFRAFDAVFQRCDNL